MGGNKVLTPATTAILASQEVEAGRFQTQTCLGKSRRVSKIKESKKKKPKRPGCGSCGRALPNSKRPGVHFPVQQQKRTRKIKPHISSIKQSTK
jgi:hypothetical protein